MQDSFVTTFELDNYLLKKIFLDTNNNSQQIDQLLRWNKSNKPPMSIVKSQFEQFLLKSNHLQQCCKNIISVLTNLLDKKANLNIFRAFLNILKQNKTHLNIQRQNIKPFWTKVSVEYLELFLETFDLKQFITPQEHSIYIKELIQNQKFTECKKLSKILGLQEKHVNLLINSMATNKSASKAADFIHELKLNPKQYPQINERLAKTCVRHFLKKQGWQYVEELYQQNPLMIGFAVQDLIFDNKFNEGITLCIRHDLQKKNLIRKKNILEIIKQKQLEGYKILDNFLFTINHFAPLDEKQYLNLSDFGITQQNIVWVNKDTPKLQVILEELFSSEIVGIDTQSLVGTTKLQNQKSGLALIQISTFNKIYLFDCFNIESQLIKKYFKQFFASQSLKIGHTLAGDMRAICEHLKIQKNVQKVIDISKIFKCLYPQDKYCNLSYISKKILGKPICKVQTLTNWKRRPLRLNQLHYAAMDAFVVLKIYQKMKSEYGQLIQYYAEEDDIRQQIEYN